MARRKWQGALAGMGQGMMNVSDYMMRQRGQNQAQDRIDERQEAAALRSAVLKIQDDVAAGLKDPEQGAAQIAGLVGNKVAPGTIVPSLEAIRPPMRRRLGKRFDESIEKADKVSALPTDDSIANAMRTEGAATLPPEWSEGMLPIDNDPFQSFKDATVGRDLSAQSGAKRRVLESEPTEKIVGKDAQGRDYTQLMSKLDLTGKPFFTSPTSQEMGKLKGAEEVATTEVAGDSRVKQGAKVAGANAQATQDVQMSPEAVAARTREAVNKEVQTFRATMPMRLQEAAAKAAAEIQAGVSKTNAQALAASTKAAVQLAPFFAKVSDLTKQLNNQEGALSRVKGGYKIAQNALGGAPEITELNQLIRQNLRNMAIAMGVTEANVAEKETQQALDGIGLYAWSSATERRNALRNLNDLITLGPVVAGRLDPNASIGERIQFAQGLMQQRRTAEQEAIGAKAAAYIDPVLGVIVKVIQ